MEPIFVGVIACVLLAFLFDGVILGVTYLATPWQRAGKTAS
jgi:osmoprotectant transport system permease protein